MTEKYNISAYLDDGSALTMPVSPEVFARIAQAVPELITREGTVLCPPAMVTEHPDVLRILEAMHQAGVDMSDKIALRKAGIYISRMREYAPKDLIHAEYVQPWHTKYLGQTACPAQCDEAGVPYLKAPITPRACECGALANTSLILVRGKVKEALEQAGLTGLRLVRPQVAGKKPVPDSEMAWAVWSDVTLPPMLNLCQGEGGIVRYEPADLPPPEGRRYREYQPYQGFLAPAEMHYRRSAVAAVGSPDVAITWERFGGAVRRHRPVFSRRCLAFFREELGISLGGKPVHLCDDADAIIPWMGVFPDPKDPRNQRPPWLAEMAAACV